MQIRNNKTELKKQIQTLKDRMDTFNPESEEHKKCHEQYVELLSIEKDLKDLEISGWKVAAGVVAPVCGLFLYRKMFDTSADPFFRDLGRSILQTFKHI